MGILELVSGPGMKRQTYTLDRDCMVLGRYESSDICVIESSISGEHAQIVRRDGKYYLEDLGSKNGTLLNRKAVDGSCELNDSDEIQLCNFTFRVVIDEPKTDENIESTVNYLDADTEDSKDLLNEDSNMKVAGRMTADSDSSGLRAIRWQNSVLCSSFPVTSSKCSLSKSRRNVI